MKRFKNVLVVYDDGIGGDDALGQAVALARENAACLTVATVLRDNELSPRTLDETRKRLQRLGDSVVQQGVREVHTRVLTGTPFIEIVRLVISARHDLVITSAEAGSVLKGVFFGSTATHLMRKCPCPVWIVKPGQSAPYRKILAAVDPKGGADNDPLNTKIMDLATSLASRDHSALHILHAWEVDGKDLDTIRSELPPGTRDAILEKHRERHRTAVRDLLAKYPMGEIRHSLHMPRERPEKAITSLVETEQVDLIVMGTVRKTGIPGLLIGTAAESVLSSVKCGLLTVKPDGFETPVSLPEDYPADQEQTGPVRGEIKRVA